MKYAPRPKRLALLARCCKLSSLRIAKFGPPPVSIDNWWQQINEVAAEHHVDMPTFEQWRDAANVDQWEDLP